MTWPWFVIAIAVILWIYWTLSRADRERREGALRHFGEMKLARNPQNVHEFARDCGAEDADDVAYRVRMILLEISQYVLRTDVLEVDPTRLRSQDELGQDLAFDVDSLALARLPLEMEREFKVPFTSEEFIDARTVGDVVRIVSHKVHPPDPSPPI